MPSDLVSKLCLRINEHINQTLNALLHHPRFQALEASWRGLDRLINASEGKSQSQIRLLHLPYHRLTQDMHQATDPDQTILYRKLVTETLDMPGGIPFSLLVGDYYFSHQAAEDDITTLRNFSAILAEGFLPFVSGVSPAFLGVDNFSALHLGLNYKQLFDSPDYDRWHAFRRTAHARYIGLVMPRIKMREPYEAAKQGLKPGYLREMCSSDSDLCFGNAVYAYAAKILTSYEATGWFAGMRQPETASDFFTYPSRTQLAPGIECLPTAETLVSDVQERTLSESGLLVLCDRPFFQVAHFYSTVSIQLPEGKGQMEKQAELASMLDYLLCVCRFGQYLKLLLRDKVGVFSNQQACENYLQRWILRYCMSSASSQADQRHHYPLKQARITVETVPNQTDRYLCRFHLSPHLYWEQLQTEMHLTTTLRLSRAEGKA